MLNILYFLTYLSCMFIVVLGDSGDECNNNGTIYATGQRFKPKDECVEITCLGNNTYSAQNCTILTPPAGYSLTEYNVSLAYPYCCPQLVHNVVEDPASYCQKTNSSLVFQPARVCQLETCEGGKNTLVQECIKYSLLLGYELDKGNLSLPFPECCPKPVPVMSPTDMPTTNTYSPLCHKFGRTFRVGEKLQIPRHCGYYLCLGNNQWTKTMCAVVNLPPGWTLSRENPNKPFPWCCPRAVVPGELLDKGCAVCNSTYKSGDHWRPDGECAQASCIGDNRIVINYCPHIEVNSTAGYKLSEMDMSKDFPACCPQPVMRGPCVVDGQIFPIGSQVDYERMCQRNVCIGDDLFDTQPCPAIQPPPGGAVCGYRLALPYPACCPRAVDSPVCPDE